MSNGKARIILLIVGMIKNTLLHKMSYFPELYIHSKNKIKLELDLPNYATKSDLRSTTGVDTTGVGTMGVDTMGVGTMGVGTSKFAKKTNIASLKSDIDESDDFNSLKSNLDKLDIDKLQPGPVDFRKIK